jgi:hypothetical protein
LLEDPWKVSNLHRSALGLHKTPWKFLGPCNVALGAWGGAARRILARPAAGMAGGAAGEGLGTVGNRFRCLLAAERWPEGMDGGVR